MLRGFYTAASGILMQQRKINVLTNNIANAETPGYRASRVVSSTFEQELMTRLEGSNTEHIGSTAQIQVVSEVPTRFDPSSLEETGRPMDLALEGEGFFNVQAEDADGNAGQTYLTRNGDFELDATGRLVLSGVGVVLGQKGAIQVNDSKFTVSADGSVYNSKGKYVDKLLVTIPPEGTKISQQANGFYTTENMQANINATGTLVRQGVLENSNIDLNREYTLVMEAQRALQASSSALQIIDGIDQKAAAQIAAL